MPDRLADSRYAAALLAGRILPTEVWDCHAHLDAVRYHYIPGGGDAGSMVAFMDRLGIRATCISHHMMVTGDVAEGNRLACEAATRFPGRFYVYLGYNPHYPVDWSMADLERHRGHPAVVGLKFHPGTHVAAQDCPGYRPAFEYARDHGLMILSHTWGTRDIAGVARMVKEFPTVPYLMGHTGGYEFAAIYDALRVAQENENAYLDLCLSGMFDGQIELFVKEAGSRKVLFGSDTPFMDPRGNLGRVAFARVGDADKERILGGNLKALLGSRGG
jgi:predicted TIM-barrel fold metal-dependent hydrolase